MHQAQVHELLYQALETELGGIHVYQTALQCTVNAELTQEWHNGRWSAISGTRWSPPWRWL